MRHRESWCKLTLVYLIIGLGPNATHCFVNYHPPNSVGIINPLEHIHIAGARAVLKSLKAKSSSVFWACVQSMWAERSGRFCRSALNLIFLTSAHRYVPAPRPLAHAPLRSTQFFETRSRSAPLHPSFGPLRSVSAPLTLAINSVANSGLLGLRVALFYSLLW